MKKVAYDCRNRLIEAKTDSGEATKYAYDAENVRIKVIKNAGTQKESITTYVTDSVSDDLSRVLQAETVDKNGTTETTLYTYGKGLIAQEKGAEYLLYHFAHLGSTTAVTDVGGEIKYTYAYNIFGKLLGGNYGEVEFLYNGQYGVTSDANGLYYMRARYYNIDIMRFINQDILTGSIDSSQSSNRYAYVEGNPVNFLDPLGLAKTIDDELHEWTDEAKKGLSYIDTLNSINSLGSQKTGHKIKLRYTDGASVKWSLGEVFGIGNFVANTAITWFDIGVSVNEWIDAARDMDADRMIDINYEIADSVMTYTLDTLFFTVDLYTGFSLSIGLAVAYTISDNLTK